MSSLVVGVGGVAIPEVSSASACDDANSDTCTDMGPVDNDVNVQVQSGLTSELSEQLNEPIAEQATTPPLTTQVVDEMKDDQGGHVVADQALSDSGGWMIRPLVASELEQGIDPVVVAGEDMAGDDVADERTSALDEMRLGRAWRPVDEWGNRVDPPIRETRVVFDGDKRVEIVREYVASPDGNLTQISGPPQDHQPSVTEPLELEPLEVSRASEPAVRDRELGEPFFEESAAKSVLSDRDLGGVVAHTVEVLSEDRLASTTVNTTVIKGDETSFDVVDVKVTTNIGIVTSVELGDRPSTQSHVDAVQRGIGRWLPTHDPDWGNSLADADKDNPNTYSGSDPGNDGSYEQVGNLGLSGAAG